MFNHVGNPEDITLSQALRDGAYAHRAPGVMSSIVTLFVFDRETLFHFFQNRAEQRGFKFLRPTVGPLIAQMGLQLFRIAHNLRGERDDLRRVHITSRSACKAPAALSACKIETTSRALAPIACSPLTSC